MTQYQYLCYEFCCLHQHANHVSLHHFCCWAHSINVAATCRMRQNFCYAVNTLVRLLSNLELTSTVHSTLPRPCEKFSVPSDIASVPLAISYLINICAPEFAFMNIPMRIQGIPSWITFFTLGAWIVFFSSILFLVNFQGMWIFVMLISGLSLSMYRCWVWLLLSTSTFTSNEVSLVQYANHQTSAKTLTISILNIGFATETDGQRLLIRVCTTGVNFSCGKLNANLSRISAIKLLAAVTSAHVVVFSV